MPFSAGFILVNAEHKILSLCSSLACQPKAGKGGTCPAFAVVMLLLDVTNL